MKQREKLSMCDRIEKVCVSGKEIGRDRQIEREGERGSERCHKIFVALIRR